MGKKVIVNIKSGKVQTEFHGFQGQACKQLGERLHGQILVEEEVTNKPELFQEPGNTYNESGY